MRFDNFDSDTMIQVQSNNAFGFSATKLENLEALEYTLVTIALDTSGSVMGFRDELINCVKEIIKACQKSPRVDNLLLRMVTFNSNLSEFHGFKMLSYIQESDYDNFIHCGGATALYDAAYTSVESVFEYGKTLTNNDYTANGICFVITDGEDNSSTFTPDKIKTYIDNEVKKESIESIVTVLVGIGDDYSSYLTEFKNEAGFTQYVNIKDASKNNLAKLAQFVSKSISSQSNSLGTGGPSQQISITI